MVLAIETSGLTRRYGSILAVDNIELAVPEGSVYGFLGPNGSGKTTTLRMLMGLIEPNRGEIRMRGHNLRSSRKKALSHVGAIIEQPALYPSLTGRAHLAMACTLLGYSRKQIDPLLETVGLTAAARRKVKGYSLGMKQRLAIARALIGDPKLLILDEPTNGLDPSGIAEMRALVKSLPGQFGTTVLLSSHLLAEVEQVATHCGLVRQGKLVFQGPLSELKARAGSSLIIEASDLEAVAKIMAETGLKPRIEGDRVIAPCDMDREQLADLLATIVRSGIGVSHFELRQAQLESLFLELTGPNGQGS